MTPEKTREQTAAHIAAGHPSPVQYNSHRQLPPHLWREGSYYAAAVKAAAIREYGVNDALRWS